MFPNAIVCVPSNKVEYDIRRDLLQIKSSLKDPRLWVGQYQPEDIVCFADSDGGIQFHRISKEGITKHKYPVESKHQTLSKSCQTSTESTWPSSESAKQTMSSG